MTTNEHNNEYNNEHSNHHNNEYINATAGVEVDTVADSMNIEHPDTEQELSILIVSGRSGSGKTSAINILEDFGYYAIDNLPLDLLVDAVDKLQKDAKIHHIALGIDIRTPNADLSQFSNVYHKLQQRYGYQALKVIYIKADETVLIARFDATRRVHPLMSSMDPSLQSIQNLPIALETEKALLSPIKNHANLIINTSQLNIHQLKATLREHLGIDNKVTICVTSFGFKYGIPLDADFIFDVRILPNPHWEPNLRKMTGKDEPVIEFFSKHPEVDDMGKDTSAYLAKWLPSFLENNRYCVTVAIGCTGGKHRSVYITEMIAKTLQDKLPHNMEVTIKHREQLSWQ